MRAMEVEVEQEKKGCCTRRAVEITFNRIFFPDTTSGAWLQSHSLVPRLLTAASILYQARTYVTRRPRLARLTRTRARFSRPPDRDRRKLPFYNPLKNERRSECNLYIHARQRRRAQRGLDLLDLCAGSKKNSDQATFSSFFSLFQSPLLAMFFRLVALHVQFNFLMYIAWLGRRIQHSPSSN